MSKLQVGVLFGSRSCEHDVSVISAVQLMRPADTEKYDIWPVYISKTGEWFTGKKLLELSTFTPFDPNANGIIRVNIDVTAGSGALLHMERGKGLLAKDKQIVVTRLDCVIPVFHGLHGEDGTIQGLLELCDIPYSSSGVGASAIGMDKVFMKQFFRGAGFPVLPDCWVLRREWEKDADAIVAKIESNLSYPVFVKPASQGSSIGVSCAKNRDGLKEALKLAFDFDRKVLVEKGLTKPLELNCSVLGFDGEAEASEIEMPISSGDMLDFAKKYLSQGGSKGMTSLQRVLPAPIDDGLKKKIQELSVEIFRSMDCRGVVRIDYMYDVDSDGLYITEINTLPGSMAFYLWEASGLRYKQLIDRLIRIALDAKKEKDDCNYAYSSDILKNISFGGKTGAKNGEKLG